MTPEKSRPDPAGRLRVAAVQMEFVPTIDGNLAAIERFMAQARRARADAVLSLKSWSLRPVIGWPSPVADGWGRDYEPPNILERISGDGDDRVLWPHLHKPTGYWTWAKDPWDAGRTRPTPDFETGTLDFLLPYWMARYYRVIR